MGVKLQYIINRKKIYFPDLSSKIIAINRKYLINMLVWFQFLTLLPLKNLH